MHSSVYDSFHISFRSLKEITFKKKKKEKKYSFTVVGTTQREVKKLVIDTGTSESKLHIMAKGRKLSIHLHIYWHRNTGAKHKNSSAIFSSAKSDTIPRKKQ